MSADELSFRELREANVPRCIGGFGHSLASWSPAEWTNAMCGEAGEAANVAKKMIRHRDGVGGNRGEDRDLSVLREKLGRELADTVIYADLAAAREGIDLGLAVREAFTEKSQEIGWHGLLGAPAFVRTTLVIRPTAASWHPAGPNVPRPIYHDLGGCCLFWEPWRCDAPGASNAGGFHQHRDGLCPELERIAIPRDLADSIRCSACDDVLTRDEAPAPK